MAEAAALLAGRHDFRLFCERPAEQPSTLVVVESVEVATAGALILVRLAASHFLWKMVRRVVGTLVKVGSGRLAPAAFEALLAGEGPGRAARGCRPSGRRRLRDSSWSASSIPATRRSATWLPPFPFPASFPGRVSFAPWNCFTPLTSPPGTAPFPRSSSSTAGGPTLTTSWGSRPCFTVAGALVLCPQGPIALPIGGGNYGYGWFPLNPGTPPDIAAFRRGADALRAFVDGAMARYPIDPQKIVPMGFSQGGVMAFDLALRDPGRYAGVGALSSWFPELLAEDLPKVPGHEGFPVLIVHGTEDSMLEVEKARESRELLRPFGVTLTYREFEMGHEIRPEALRVILKWLDEKALAAR